MSWIKGVEFIMDERCYY